MQQSQNSDGFLKEMLALKDTFSGTLILSLLSGPTLFTKYQTLAELCET